MNIVLNFIPLKAGGGVQVGLDFVAQAQRHGAAHQWYLVATESTPFAAIEPSDHLRIAALVPDRKAARLWFEYVGCRALLRRIRPDVIYTQFGPQWPGARAPQVVGCAYSNLLYPEIDFWDNWPWRQRLVKKAIDFGRRRRMLAADALIFETGDLRARAMRLFGRTPESVFCVRPSVSSLVSGPASTATYTDLRPGFKVLLLSRYHPNKNFHLLPRIARELQTRHAMHDVRFVITLPPEAPTTRALLKSAEQLGVGDAIVNVGPVAPDRCHALYRACDAAILPSRLESFSNNIAEAWAMERPLVTVALDWARSLCGDGAIYFGYNDAADAARAIAGLRTDDAQRSRVVACGTAMLRSYPTAQQRFERYLDIIERCAAGALSAEAIRHVP